MAGKICKMCVFWDKKKEKTFILEKVETRFRGCMNEKIDGVQKKTHKADTMVLAMSKAKHPLYTHAKFGCVLFEHI